MVVNFRAREISRGTRKLDWTPMLNLKKKNYLSRFIAEDLLNRNWKIQILRKKCYSISVIQENRCLGELDY